MTAQNPRPNQGPSHITTSITTFNQVTETLITNHLASYRREHQIQCRRHGTSLTIHNIMDRAIHTYGNLSHRRLTYSLMETKSIDTS